MYFPYFAAQMKNMSCMPQVCSRCVKWCEIRISSPSLNFICLQENGNWSSATRKDRARIPRENTSTSHRNLEKVSTYFEMKSLKPIVTCYHKQVGQSYDWSRNFSCMYPYMDLLLIYRKVQHKIQFEKKRKWNWNALWDNSEVGSLSYHCKYAKYMYMQSCMRIHSCFRQNPFDNCPFVS